MTSNYDNSAFFYDKLSRMVFGKSLIKAQVYLLKFVPPNASVLIVGGGTGWILDELANIHYSGLDITYVEISEKMTALARSRSVGINKVEFVIHAIENTSIDKQYDVIITPFLLDSFTEETLEKTFAHMHQQLKAGGLWLICDFRLTGKFWQIVLLKTMYLFFKVICQIETFAMPTIENQFTKRHYEKLNSQAFYGDFIISSIYKKEEATR